MTAVKPAVFLAAIFLIGSLAASRAESPRRIEITAKKFTYDPDVITLKKGEPVVLVLRSIDVTHGLKVDGLNVKSGDIKERQGGRDSAHSTTNRSLSRPMRAFLRQRPWRDETTN